jgi:hypothetical protein
MIDADAKALRADGEWPHVYWGSAPLLPVGHWHGGGDLYLAEEGALYGYAWGRDRLCAAAGSACALLEFMALWWETYEKPIESPRYFEIILQTDIASQLTQALSVPRVEVASDQVCARFQEDGLLIEGIAAPYPGGPRTTLWADLPVLVASPRVARELAPQAPIIIEQDYAAVSAALQKSGLFTSAAPDHCKG